MAFVIRCLGALSFLLVLGCAVPATKAPQPGTYDEINGLANAVYALAPDIAWEEAQQLAQISYSETYRLAQLYEIEDPPLTHNTKVNLGSKPRGLCYHWADDLERRLKREGFQTLTLHRGVANFDSLRLEHSTVIVSARGQGLQDGIVLDPWRKGGRLTWVLTRQDPRYTWIPRSEVFRIRRERRARSAH